VRKYMRELETVGLLVQKRRGLGKTNLYTLCSLSRATLEQPLPPRKAETDDQERGSLGSDDQDHGSFVSDDQDAPLSDALEGNPCSEEEDSTEKDTDEEGFDSKGTALHADHADEGSVRQPTRRQPRGVGRGRAVRPAVPARAEHAVPPSSPTEVAPPVLEVAPPVPDDQALVVLLAELGDEFGDRAARSSLTRVRTLRQRHGLAVEEVTRHLDQAARLTRACRTVQPDRRMAYLLTVLENSMASPPAAVTPLESSGHRRWGHPAPPASSERPGISRYIGGSYGVCAHCFSSPCELDCPTRTHDMADHTAAADVPGSVHAPGTAPGSYATC